MTMTQQPSRTAASRQAAIAEMLSQVRTIAQDKGINRESLEDIKAEMVQVATHKELFPLADFQPAEAAPGRRPMQLLHKDDDGQFALYMSTSVSDQKPPPHNHATWAVIVGIQGEERNWLFERTDDGSVPGKGMVRVVDERVAAPGTGVALMPEDIHTIQGKATAGGRLTLHLYGVATDLQQGRVAYNEAEGTYRPFPPGRENQLPAS
jgi:predicted metal-dependent enzyme (double-stranded beta helix superfamily)